MNKLLTLLLAVTVVSTLSNAEGKKPETPSLNPHVHAVTTEHLNNVIQLDADGHRTALCGCGMQFQVTNDQLSVQNGDETIYCCSEACHHSNLAMPNADRMQKISDLNEKLSHSISVTNTAIKDGRTVATCLCGKEFEVTDQTPRVSENGVTLNLCGEACTTGLHKMSAADRFEAELKIVTAKKKSAESKR